MGDEIRIFRGMSSQAPAGKLLSSKPNKVTHQFTEPEGRSAMIRLIIAIAIGAVIAVGGVFVVENVLNTASNGTPSSQSLYNYGQR
jgi:hypothetical protein